MSKETGPTKTDLVQVLQRSPTSSAGAGGRFVPNRTLAALLPRVRSGPWTWKLVSFVAALSTRSVATRDPRPFVGFRHFSTRKSWKAALPPPTTATSMDAACPEAPRKITTEEHRAEGESLVLGEFPWSGPWRDQFAAATQEAFVGPRGDRSLDGTEFERLAYHFYSMAAGCAIDVRTELKNNIRYFFDGDRLVGTFGGNEPELPGSGRPFDHEGLTPPGAILSRDAVFGHSQPKASGGHYGWVQNAKWNNKGAWKSDEDALRCGSLRSLGRMAVFRPGEDHPAFLVSVRVPWSGTVRISLVPNPLKTQPYGGGA